MAIRVRCLREITRFFPHIRSGMHSQQLGHAILLSTFCLEKFSNEYKVGHCSPIGDCTALRYTTIPETTSTSSSEGDLLSFIESTSDELEGPHHCWLNKVEGSRESENKDGIFLIFTNLVSEGSCLENVKILQQRYPQLNVIGFQSGSSVLSMDKVELIQTIMKEYITFPILLSNKIFSEIVSRGCFLFFKDCGSPKFCYQSDADLVVLINAIEELNGQNIGTPSLSDKLKGTWLKQIEVFKEPFVGSSMRNLFLYFPGCISVDEDGSRLFLSDCSHHRIIVFDGVGKILDCIGSSPGFEDGDFESAKLARPAASFYDATEDCLYFVDSENHAIRRADFGRRLLETLHPSRVTNMKSNSIWKWIMSRLGMGGNNEAKPADVNAVSLVFPWHLMKSNDGNILIMNRSCKYLWILDVASGEIKEVITGFPKIWEFCGQMILEKLSILKQIPHEMLKEKVGDPSSKGIFCVDLMSSLATFHNYIVICDIDGHRLLKYCKDSEATTSFHFSNFGVLGLPYWFSPCLEKVWDGGRLFHGECADHIQSFSLLPGKIDVKLTVDLPEDTELVEPFQEGCVWRQTRGSAIEISVLEGIVSSSDKVGAAQKWYDDLDNLVFTSPEAEETEMVNATSKRNFQEESPCINCAINTSPGSSEVLVSAVLYLKLKRRENLVEVNRENDTARIASLLNRKEIAAAERDACQEFWSKENRDLSDLIFMKPLQVRLRFDCPDHPKSENLRDIILTDSAIDVNVSLDSGLCSSSTSTCN